MRHRVRKEVEIMWGKQLEMEREGTGWEVRKGVNFFYKHLLCIGNGTSFFACIVSVNPEANLHLLASFYR